MRKNNFTEINYCKQCDKVFYRKKNSSSTGWKDRKFCNKNCSAIYNNTGRKHSVESRIKTCNSLATFHSNKNNTIPIFINCLKPERYCIVCNKKLKGGKKYCKKHIDNINIINAIYASKMAFTKYEKLLLPLLENIYGNLSKEIINDIVFDFCNNKFIIEFTFDQTQGASVIIKRFSVINDKRIKIAYIPKKYLGIKRIESLNKLNVIIFYSDEYIQYHPNKPIGV